MIATGDFRSNAILCTVNKKKLSRGTFIGQGREKCFEQKPIFLKNQKNGFCSFSVLVLIAVKQRQDLLY